MTCAACKRAVVSRETIEQKIMDLFDSNNGISKYCLRDRMISNPNPQTVNKIQRSYSFFWPRTHVRSKGEFWKARRNRRHFFRRLDILFPIISSRRKWEVLCPTAKNASCMKGETGNCKSQESISADAWKCAGTAIYTTGNTNPKIREKTPNPPSARLQKTDFFRCGTGLFSKDFKSRSAAGASLTKRKQGNPLQECPQQNSLDPFFSVLKWFDGGIAQSETI